MWSGQLIDQCLRGLTKLGKNFKYVVTCVLCQNNGAEMNTMAATYFDETDGVVTKSLSVNDLFLSLSVFGLLI